MKSFLSSCVVVVHLLFAPVCVAQEKPVTAETKTGKKTAVIDFSDVTITGDMVRPAGSYLMSRKKMHFKLLVKVRNNFLPELLESIDHF
jgi:hypothetical protein